MAEKLKPYILELVKRWRERLELVHWDFDLYVLHDDDGTIGRFSPIDGRFRASVYISNEESFEDTRMVVVHELLHAVVNDGVESVKNLNGVGVFTQQGWEVFHKQWTRQMELGVDHLTRLFLAMPHWKDDDLDPAKANGKKGRK